MGGNHAEADHHGNIEKRPVAIRSRDVERDFQSLVNQLVNSIPKDILLRTPYVERQHLISTRSTQGINVELKSSMARRVQFVDAKKEYEPCSDCSSGDETSSRDETCPGSQLRKVVQTGNCPGSRCEDDRGTRFCPGIRET